VVLVHKATVEFFVLPHIKGSVMAFFVRAEQRVIPDKAFMLCRFPLPHATVFRINGNVLFLDLKKHHVDKHGIRRGLAEERPGLFPDDAVGVQIVAALERLDRFFVLEPMCPSTGPGFKPALTSAHWTSETLTPATRMLPLPDFEEDEKLDSGRARSRLASCD
jgi:hypothetical protein